MSFDLWQEQPLTGDFCAGIITSTIMRDERGEAVA